VIYKNQDGTIYRVKTKIGKVAIPVLPLSNELKPLEDKLDMIKEAVLELEEVINFILEK